MSDRKFSLLFAAVASIAAVEAHAAAIDLGMAGSFNIYTLGNFSGANSSIRGAAAAGGNFIASNYSINQSDQDGAGSYALAVGGALTYANGSISKGSYYSGGPQSFSNVGFNSAAPTSVAPFDFTTVSNEMRALSNKLATLEATGTSQVAYGGMKLTGSNGTTTVFDLSGSQLSSINYFNFASLAPGDTLIVNVSGIDVTLQGGWNAFRDYNVLFNFYEAESLRFNGVGVYGSILAPFATVTGGSGSIDGNVIVGSWNSNLALNATHYFVPTDISGFAAGVPEPQTYVLLLTGLGLLCCFTRRQRRAGAE